jgi:diadenosine tetraphosphate (Ap4A) HIT family hydrolase
MSEIFRTKHFILESHDNPEVDRADGGHIKITPLRDVSARTQLTPQEAIDYMRLSIVAGCALTTVMLHLGFELGRINYQENGNWKPHMHEHLYGRAKNAKYQTFGDPIKPGHKEEYHPLTEDDIALLRAEIEKLFASEEFSDEEWHL